MYLQDRLPCQQGTTFGPRPHRKIFIPFWGAKRRTPCYESVAILTNFVPVSCWCHARIIRLRLVYGRMDCHQNNGTTKKNRKTLVVDQDMTRSIKSLSALFAIVILFPLFFHVESGRFFYIRSALVSFLAAGKLGSTWLGIGYRNRLAPL